MNNGRRKAELPRFKVDYFDKCNLICNGALYKTPEQIVTKGKGSKGKLLYAYTLATSFQPYLDLWLAERKRLGIKSRWLFPICRNGVWSDEPIGVKSMDNMAAYFTNIIGKPFYWHSMRHFFTTRLAEANLPEQVIQDMIGWESADMVRKYIDTTAEEKFDLYFDANGIKPMKQTELSEL
jgi:integrase